MAHNHLKDPSITGPNPGSGRHSAAMAESKPLHHSPSAPATAQVGETEQIMWVFLVEIQDAGDASDPSSWMGKLIAGLKHQKLSYKITSAKRATGKTSLMQVGASFPLLLHLAEEKGVRLKQKDGHWADFTVDHFHDFQGCDHNATFLSAARVQGMVMGMLEGISDGVVSSGWPMKIIHGETGKCLVAEMQKAKKITHIMALHDDETREALAKKWIAFFGGWKQPLDDIRKYYGARVALYFAFLGYYTAFLAFPAVGGLALYVYRQRTGTLDNLPTVVYSLVVPVWATVLLEMWKRYRNVLVHDWGLLEDEKETQPHKKHLAELRANNRTSWSLRLLSFAVMLFFISVNALGTFLFEYTTPCSGTKWSLCPDEASLGGQAGLLLSVGHAVGYVAFGMVMIEVSKVVGTKLNDLETHVDDQQKENRLLAKVFPSYFIVYYITLFYYAFWLRDMTKLRAWLGKLLVIKQLQSFAMEVVVPVLKGALLPKIAVMFKGKGKGGGGEGDATIAEKRALSLKDEMAKPAYDEGEIQEGLFDDYLEICFQFGYVVLFSAAYPLAGLMAFINNLVEIRSDAYKVLRLVRRPRARRAVTMGVWLSIFEVMGFVSVITNCAIIGFVSTELDRVDLSLVGQSPGRECVAGAPVRGSALGYARTNVCEDVHLMQKMFVVFMIEHSLLFIKYLLMRNSNTQPVRVAEELARQEAFDTLRANEARGKIKMS